MASKASSSVGLPLKIITSFVMLTEVELVSNDSTSIQFTRVPFSSSVTELISSIDISGRLPAAEILENMNVIEFTSKSGVAETDCEDKICEYLLAVVSPSGIREKVHSRRLPEVVHVNSN